MKFGTFALILPYFGRFNSYFPLFLESCRRNEFVDWLVFCDDRTNYDYPQNVKVHYTSLAEIRERIQSQWDFEVNVDSGYRLCTFRPAYGEIFSDFIAHYEYWGFCDCDLIWGNLERFLPRNYREYDRIGRFGHCMLVRNCDHMNRLYRYSEAYKTAFSSDLDLLFFDEQGFKYLCDVLGKRTWKARGIADFYPRCHRFKLIDSESEYTNPNARQIFSWDNGELMRHYLMGGDVQEHVMTYIHFLKRPFDVSESLDLSSPVGIVPNFISNLKIPVDKMIIERHSRDVFYTGYWRARLLPRELFSKIIHRWRVESRRRKVFKDILRQIAEAKIMTKTKAALSAQDRLSD